VLVAEAVLELAIMGRGERVVAGTDRALVDFECVGRVWHQLSKTPGSEKRKGPGQFKWESSSLKTPIVSSTSRHDLIKLETATT
jgi:hypothetical protein